MAPGTSARDADGTFLTPEREFERWAKRGEPPGGKRLAVSLTAAMLALLCLPVWARTTWIRRASLPLRAIEAEANADSAALQFPPPALRVLAIANAAGAGADEDADTIWEALGDMRADAAGKHDARLELAVLSGDGKCVTRGRVETIDDDDDDDDDAGDSGTGKTERTDAETRAARRRNRGARLVVSAPPRASYGPSPTRTSTRGWRGTSRARTRAAAPRRTRTRFFCCRRTEPMSRW